jgi:hypothetical protein
MSSFNATLFKTIVCNLLFSTVAFAWNAEGHWIIAEIAYQELTPQTMIKLMRYNKAVNAVYPTPDLMHAASWLDYIRHHGVRTFNQYHYIDLPFSTDHTTLPETETPNAVSAIEEAQKILADAKADDFKKGVALRVLLHVTGDLHQPFHAVSRFSKRFPHGDYGGNAVLLRHNPIAKNLHAYWDAGGGWLKGKKKPTDITQIAHKLRSRFPCQVSHLTPMQWALDSKRLAMEVGYSKNPARSGAYQQQAIAITQQQLSLAGCRLAEMIRHSV